MIWMILQSQNWPNRGINVEESSFRGNYYPLSVREKKGVRIAENTGTAESSRPDGMLGTVYNAEIQHAMEVCARKNAHDTIQRVTRKRGG